VSVPNLLRLTLHWAGYGEEGDITGWFAGAPSLYTEADLTAALAAVDSHMASETTPSAWTNLQGMLSITQSFDDLALYQYASAPGKSDVLAHRAPAPVRAGTNSPSHPLQCAVVVSVGTGSASRRKRGRMYMPGHCVAIQGDNQISAADLLKVRDAAVTFLASALAGFRASLPGGDPIRHVVFSRAGGLATASTDFTADSRFDIQRRRAASQVPLRVSPAGHVNPTS
jgi:hypothetical protein